MNTQAVLEGLLRHYADGELGAFRFGADWVADWPAGLLEELTASGVVRSAEPAVLVRCPGCHDDHVEQVEYVQHGNDLTAFVRCPELGRVRVAPESQLRWACVPSDRDR